MTLWNAKECTENVLDGFDLTWLPKGLPPQIRRFQSGSSVGVEVDTVVGSVPLTNGDTLQIRPKAGSANFLRMLFESSLGDNVAATALEGLAAYESSEELTLAALVVRPFVHALGTVAANSFQFSWSTRRERGAYLAGDIELLPTAVGLRTRASNPFVFRRSFRTYDTPENRLLLTAALVAGRRFQRMLTPSDRTFLRLFVEKLNLGPAGQPDVDRVATNLKLSIYGGARGYYRSALQLALIILGQQGFRQGGTADVRAQPVLFNSATIFEDFVRITIARAYHPRGIIVRKGFFPPLSLFKDGSGALSPDVVLSRDEAVRLVADVKYKIGSVSASDYYQMHSYAQRVGLKFGLLICATDNGQSRIVQRASNLGVNVFELYLPLGLLDNCKQALARLESKVPQFRP